MLQSSCVRVFAQSIAEEILTPAIREADDVTHIQVLQNALQKIRQSRYSAHPDFTIGYTCGQSSYEAHAFDHPGRYTLEEVTTVLRDSLARRDHEDLNAFYHLIGGPTSDYAYRVGFVLGWLMALLEQRTAPAFPSITRVA